MAMDVALWPRLLRASGSSASMSCAAIFEDQQLIHESCIRLTRHCHSSCLLQLCMHMWHSQVQMRRGLG